MSQDKKNSLNFLIISCAISVYYQIKFNIWIEFGYKSVCSQLVTTHYVTISKIIYVYI